MPCSCLCNTLGSHLRELSRLSTCGRLSNEKIVNSSWITTTACSLLYLRKTVWNNTKPHGHVTRSSNIYYLLYIHIIIIIINRLNISIYWKCIIRHRMRHIVSYIIKINKRTFMSFTILTYTVKDIKKMFNDMLHSTSALF